MTIFVLTKAMSCADEYIDIASTQVFATLKEAQQTMLSEVQRYLESEEDDWERTWGDEQDPISIHIHAKHYGYEIDDEVVWAISAHEI